MPERDTTVEPYCLLGLSYGDAALDEWVIDRPSDQFTIPGGTKAFWSGDASIGLDLAFEAGGSLIMAGYDWTSDGKAQPFDIPLPCGLASVTSLASVTRQVGRPDHVGRAEFDLGLTSHLWAIAPGLWLACYAYEDAISAFEYGCPLNSTDYLEGRLADPVQVVSTRDLHADVATITDGSELAAFVRNLIGQVHLNAGANGPFNAENFDLEAFLTSIAEWSETEGAQRQISAANPYSAIAGALLVGHYHE